MVKKLEPGLTGEVTIHLSLLLVLISAVPCPIFTASVRGNGGGSCPSSLRCAVKHNGEM